MTMQERIPTAKIEVVPYSYNYLKSIVDETTIHMQEYDISSIRLNEKNNCVYISTSKEYEAERFLTVNGYDKNAVRLEKKANVVTAANESTQDSDDNNDSRALTATTRYARAGEKVILNNDVTRYGSIGFNAYKSQTGQYGIVTCAHVVTGETSFQNRSNYTMDAE